MAKIVSLAIDCKERSTKHMITFDVEFDKALTVREAESEIQEEILKGEYIVNELKSAIRSLMEFNDLSDKSKVHKMAYNQAMDDAYDALKKIVGEV